MSHYPAWVVVPKEYVEKHEIKQIDDELEDFVEEILKPFDENREELFKTYIYETKAVAEGWFERKKKEKPETYSNMTYEKFVKCYYEEEIDCNGNVMCKRNPNAKWDYYEVGGRWSGFIPNNFTLVEKILEDDVPFAVVDGNGWHEQGKAGWWGMVSNKKKQPVWDKEVKKILAEHIKDYVVLIDCHI